MLYKRVSSGLCSACWEGGGGEGCWENPISRIQEIVGLSVRFHFSRSGVSGNCKQSSEFSDIDKEIHCAITGQTLADEVSALCVCVCFS